MPLVSIILQKELSKIMDENDPNFLGFSSDVFVVASRWANALNTYASAVIPASTTSAVSLTAMQGVLMQIQPGVFPLASSITAYAASLSIGMLGASFVGAPPTAPLDLSPAFYIPLVEGSNAQRVSAITSIIDSWFHTGTATNVISGATMTWN
jgi:hypothetical protein